MKISHLGHRKINCVICVYFNIQALVWGGGWWWCDDLLPTSAGLVVYELKSRCAVTLKANHHVFADVRAATIVHQTLV